MTNTSKIVTQKKANNKVHIGIDVHRRSYALTAVKEGEIVKKWSMPSGSTNLAKVLKAKFRRYEINSVYEAGFSGYLLHRKLAGAGIKNIVVNAADVAVSSGDRVKTDKRDSEKLAKHLSCGMLRGIRIPSIEEELRRQLTRSREQFVRSRTRVMLQIRSRLHYFGYMEDYTGGVLTKKYIRGFIENLKKEDELKWCLTEQYRLWEALDTGIKNINNKLLEQAEQCPFEELYRVVFGIGKVSSRVLINELGDMSQFKNEKELFSFVGLTPSENSSGENIRRGHISRQGNPLLRKILVEAAWKTIQKDSSLKVYFTKLSVRRGTKRAIVAVARKLIGRIRASIRKGEAYSVEPKVNKQAK